MNRRNVSLFAVLALVAVAPSLHAQTAVKPAIVYANGGKFDKSFNEGVSTGAQKFTAETKIAVADFEPGNETQFEQALRRFAQRGQDPIIAVGFSQATALEKVAREFPAVHFTLIDSVVDLPNVQSVLFKEQEGSFLVGMAAALASKSGKVGFVGGMDIPLIRRFACGYAQGAHAVRPDVEVLQNMTGSTPRGAIPAAAPSSPRASSIAASMSSMQRPVPPAPVCCRPPRTAASTRSASTPTRITCTPAPC